MSVDATAFLSADLKFSGRSLLQTSSVAPNSAAIARKALERLGAVQQAAATRAAPVTPSSQSPGEEAGQLQITFL
jgi:hypothetical protein